MEPQQPQGYPPQPGQPPAEPMAPPPAEPMAPPPAASSPVAPPPISVPPPVAPAPAPTGGWQVPAEELGPAPGVRFAGPGARLIAFVVDWFIVGVALVALSLVLLAIVGLAASNESDVVAGLAGILWVGSFLVVSLAYFPYFWARGGQTPGMKLFRIRVVRDLDGGPITTGTAVLRLIGYWISQAVFYIGFIWIFVDKRHRGWHDLIAGTVVIEA